MFSHYIIIISITLKNNFTKERGMYGHVWTSYFIYDYTCLWIMYIIHYVYIMYIIHTHTHTYIYIYIYIFTHEEFFTEWV